MRVRARGEREVGVQRYIKCSGLCRSEAEWGREVGEQGEGEKGKGEGSAGEHGRGLAVLRSLAPHITKSLPTLPLHPGFRAIQRTKYLSKSSRGNPVNLPSHSPPPCVCPQLPPHHHCLWPLGTAPPAHTHTHTSDSQLLLALCFLSFFLHVPPSSYARPTRC